MYRLRCFGKTAVEEETGDEVLQLRSRKHLALLLYLLSHRQRTYPRERLASLFWDTEPRLARHSLSQALYDIRNSLPGIELETTASQVGAGDNGLVFDAEQFEDAVRSNDLSRAVRLYDGRFAPDLEDAGNSDFTRWVESERNRFRRLAEMALYRHVRECDDEAEWGEMCVSALQLLEMNPLSEDAHRALMRGLWLQGDRAAAVRHFEESEAFLRRELPGGISQATLELVQRIRSSRPNVTSPGEAGEMRPQMVGRKEEFETLKGALRRLREDGKGGLVRIHGEAGMGKTRLLEEFRELTALDGVRLLESRCYAAESDVPYGPVVDGLDALATEAGDGDGERAYYQLGHLFPSAFDRPGDGRESFSEPDVGRRRLYEEAADLLRCATDAEPVVWTVEDVHWIDPSSASLLHYVARRLADSPLLLVLTSRTHEDAAAATEELLQDTNDSLGRVDDLELGPLNRDEVARLIRTVEDAEPSEEAVRRVHTLAGGNPFYALELLRSSDMDRGLAKPTSEDGTSSLITESLKTVLKRRLRGVTAKGLRILETVAVAGRHATPAVVSRAAGLPTDELADVSAGLYGRGLLRDQDGKLEFHHDITREFVYGNMGDLQRSALHLSVGQLLEERGDEADAGTLARHFEVGDDPDRAYEYALEAARDAERRHAHEEAIQMAEMAVELARQEDDLAAPLWVLAEAEMSASKMEDAQRHLSRLHSICPSPVVDIATIYVSLGKTCLELSQWKQALTYLRNAERNISDATDGDSSREQILECLHLQLKTRLNANDTLGAQQVLRRIRELNSKIDESDLTPREQALITTSLAAYELYCESSEAAHERLDSLDEIDRLPLSMRFSYLFLKGAAQLRLANWDQSRESFRTALRVAQDHNDVLAQLNAVNNLMCVSLDTGAWSDVETYYDLARELTAPISKSSRSIVLPNLNWAVARLYQADYRGGLETYSRLVDWIERFTNYNTGSAGGVYSGLGLCLLANGNFEEAETLFADLDVSGSWDDLGGVQSKEEIVWFTGFMLAKDDPATGLRYIQKRGESELPCHRVGGMRMLWLRDMIDGAIGGNGASMREARETSEWAGRLKEVGSAWYLHSTRRWLKTVMSKGM